MTTGSSLARRRVALRTGYATTVSSESYVGGALALATSLRLGGSLLPLVAFAPPTANLSKSSEQALLDAGYSMRSVSQAASDEWMQLISRRKRELHMGHSSRWSNAFQKLHLFKPGVSGFDMFAHIDADCVVKGNLDQVLPFRRMHHQRARLMAVCDHKCSNISYFNNGVMLIRPSNSFFRQLSALWFTPAARRFVSDQDIILTWAQHHPSLFRPLPRRFNTRPQHTPDAAVWSKQTSGILHFTGLPKPWHMWHEWSTLEKAIPLTDQQLPKQRYSTHGKRWNNSCQRPWALAVWRDAWNAYIAMKPMVRKGPLLVLTYATDQGRVIPSVLEDSLCGNRSAACPVINLAGPLGAVVPPYVKHSTKLSAFRSWAQRKVRAGGSRTTVVLADANDVRWFGCGESRLLPPAQQLAALQRRLEPIFGISGARVLWGAETGGMGGAPWLNGQALHLGQTPYLPQPTPARWAKLRCQNLLEQRAQRKREHLQLNGGFVIGEVGALLDMADWISHHWEQGYFRHRHTAGYWFLDDQIAASAYWRLHSEQVTIDYCSEVVANLHEIDTRELHKARSGNVYLQSGPSSVQPVCFAHGNGVHAKSTLRWLATPVPSNGGLEDREA